MNSMAKRVEPAKCDCLVQLRRMNGDVGGRQTLRKGNGPRQVARPAVIVTNQEAPDPAYGVANRQSRRCRG
jgi:hypothetical protein